MRAVVTGGTGYTGQRLVRQLLADGAAVLAVVRPGDNDPVPVGALRLEDLGDAQSNCDAFGEFKPDVVLHLAACQDLTHEPVAVDALVEANVAFAARMLSAAAASGARGFVAAGSFMTHADGTSHYAPQTMYAATKQAFRDLAAYYHRWTPLNVTVLELSDTYGPDDHRRKFLNLLADACLANESLDVTPGDQVVYPLHVDDVVSAFVHAARLLVDGVLLDEVYSVHGPKGVTIRQLVGLFESATGLHPDVRFGGRAYRPNEIMKPYTGPSLPDWTPSMSLEQGLRAAFSNRSVGHA